MSKFIEKSRVRCFQTDYQYILKPDAFLDLAQDLAGKGAQQTSFNDDNLRANNCAWVLARMQVKFDKPVRNSEGGYDFGIYGNSFNGSSEPGIVWVAYDANGNGVADDGWQELYGSESVLKNNVQRNYSITYSRTDDETKIAWRDNNGESGIIERNSMHPQDYFPAWVTEDEYTLSGTLLPDNSEWSEINQEWVLHAFEWGYADNFSAIDLAADRANRFRIIDAHDATGEANILPQIDFVKVQSATNIIHSAIGEVSTEVLGFVSYNSVE